MGLSLSRQEFAGPLSEIDDATIQIDNPAEQFVLIMHSGERVSLGYYTSQFNQSEAAEAVKHFLESARRNH